GGQGVLTAGLILSKTAVDNGKNVTWIPSYGSEMRGGTANCNVKISDSKIASPFVTKIDILIAMNMPSITKFESKVVNGGLVVVNSSMVKEYNFREDLKIIEVDASNIADEEKNARAANLVMLGALASTNAIFDFRTIEQGIKDFFDSKGKNNPKNEICVIRGSKEAKQGE
ncbi:MAG: 2-oxoacid:acceptor oxidoreductase family protein, partial [Anaerovoracaceae bacterium]